MYDWRRMSERERRAAFGARLATHRPWHGPPHELKHEYTYHLSAACYEHAPLIGASPARLAECEAELLETLKTCCERVHAWCLLPNHYHALVDTLDLDATLRLIGQFHGRTSFRWNGEEGSRGRHVWHRCADRAIRTERHYWAAMNYIHHNPVHHLYVTRWEDWPFTSAREFLARVGRAEARRLWRAYPLLEFGAGWDDPGM